jgi:hypothetical protein
MKCIILAAIAVVTLLAAGTTLLPSLPQSTKLDVASIAHYRNFHSFAGVRVSELRARLREKGSPELNPANPSR